MSELRVVDGGRPDDDGGTAPGALAGRRYVPGAPLSPGTVPLELATLLELGEAVIWWGHKRSWAWIPIAVTAGGGLAVLAFATLLAPGLWQRPLSEAWQPVAAVLAPALFLVAREWASRRALVVTDAAILGVDPRGNAQRLPLRAILRVRRDWLSGGVRLDGARSSVVIPPSLMDDARKAIALPRRDMLRGSNDKPDDPLGWLP
jgi:hypothetical protein